MKRLLPILLLAVAGVIAACGPGSTPSGAAGSPVIVAPSEMASELASEEASMDAAESPSP